MVSHLQKSAEALNENSYSIFEKNPLEAHYTNDNHFGTVPTIDPNQTPQRRSNVHRKNPHYTSDNFRANEEMGTLTNKATVG